MKSYFIPFLLQICENIKKVEEWPKINSWNINSYLIVSSYTHSGIINAESGLEATLFPLDHSSASMKHDTHINTYTYTNIHAYKHTHTH